MGPGSFQSSLEQLGVANYFVFLVGCFPSPLERLLLLLPTWYFEYQHPPNKMLLIAQLFTHPSDMVSKSYRVQVRSRAEGSPVQ